MIRENFTFFLDPKVVDKAKIAAIMKQNKLSRVIEEFLRDYTRDIEIDIPDRKIKRLKRK